MANVCHPTAKTKYAGNQAAVCSNPRRYGESNLHLSHSSNQATQNWGIPAEAQIAAFAKQLRCAKCGSAGIVAQTEAGQQERVDTKRVESWFLVEC